jgi:transcriptional regulator with XRE-family HTH domain
MGFMLCSCCQHSKEKMSMSQETLGERVKRLREAKRMKQSELADAIGVDPTVLSRILSGDREPQLEQVIAIARALDTSAADLVQDTGKEQVLKEWVPIARLVEEEQLRVQVQNELANARRELIAQVAEIQALRLRSDSLVTTNTNLEREFVTLRAQAEEVDRLREQLAAARTRETQLEGERARLSAELTETKKQLSSRDQALTVSRQSLTQVLAQASTLKRSLEATKSAQVGAVTVAGLIGGLIGAAAVAATVSEPPPTARRTTKR